MKSCKNCGTIAPDHLTRCPACGRDTLRPETGDQSAQRSEPHEHEKGTRPDGRDPITFGVIAILIAVILAIISGTIDVAFTQAMVLVAAEALFGLGVVLWLAGYIVRAISFLPGKDDA
jgi:uncharacterized membrane protein YvbJ